MTNQQIIVYPGTGPDPHRGVCPGCNQHGHLTHCSDGLRCFDCRTLDQGDPLPTRFTATGGGNRV